MTTMPKCPKCGKEIDYLNYEGEAGATFDASGYSDAELFDADGHYYCPMCRTLLFESDLEAYRFLIQEGDDDA
jgi:phage FluMu protein Com